MPRRAQSWLTFAALLFCGPPYLVSYLHLPHGTLRYNYTAPARQAAASRGSGMGHIRRRSDNRVVGSNRHHCASHPVGSSSYCQAQHRPCLHSNSCFGAPHLARTIVCHFLFAQANHHISIKNESELYYVLVKSRGATKPTCVDKVFQSARDSADVVTEQNLCPW
jgi:hypothetical protein